MDPNFSLTDEDTRDWVKLPEALNIALLGFYSDVSGDIYQMTFQFPYLPETGVLGAMEVVERKLAASGYTRATDEQVAKMHQVLAHGVIAKILNQAISERKTNQAVAREAPGWGDKGFFNTRGNKDSN